MTVYVTSVDRVTYTTDAFADAVVRRRQLLPPLLMPSLLQSYDDSVCCVDCVASSIDAFAAAVVQ